MTDPHPLARIDHTLLSPTADEAAVLALCDEAVRLGFAAVCVNPARAPAAVRRLAGTGVRTAAVAGFPLGADGLELKRAAALWLADQGVDEIDYVVDLAAAAAGRAEAVAAEAEALLVALGDRPVILKAIIETGLLDEGGVYAMTDALAGAGVGFVKTSTGLGPRGATVRDLQIMREAAAGRARLKASGGVRTRADLEAMIAAGADRIGASAGAAIAAEYAAA